MLGWRCCGLSRRFREEKWGTAGNVWHELGLPAPNSILSTTFVRSKDRRIDRVAATIGQSPGVRRKEAPLLLNPHWTVTENLVRVRRAASTAYMCYHRLKVLMGMCYHYPHPANKQAKAHREWKTYSNFTGVKGWSWDPRTSLSNSRICDLHEGCAVYVTLPRWDIFGRRKRTLCTVLP